FSSRRRHTRFSRDWSSDVCSSDLAANSPLHPEDNPHSAFGRLFDGVNVGDQTPSVDPEAERRLQEKGALVDYLKGDLGRLRTKRSEERRVGKEGRSRGSTYQCNGR